MKIAVVYREGRLRRVSRARSGECATEFFYGALELERRGHEVSLHELGYEAAPSLPRKVWDWLGARELTPSRVYGGLLAQARELCPRLAGADVVVATTPGIAFSLGLWRASGRLDAPLVAIQLGLTDHELRRARRLCNGMLLRRMHSVVFTRIEAQAMCARYRLPPSRVHVSPFGVDTAFWRPQAGESVGDPCVLAVGNDGRRDYGLLIEAVRDTEIPVRIVTARRFPPDSLPANVKIIHGDWHGEALTDGALRDLYRRARLVVVPLQDTNQPSGQSVCLQAMACARPVVLTRTRGLWESGVLRDGESVVLVPPGERTALTDAITMLWQDTAGSDRIGARAGELVRRHAGIEGFANRLEHVLQGVVPQATRVRAAACGDGG